MRRQLSGAVLLLTLVLAPAAAALPAQLSDSDMVDETRVELRVLGQAIRDDATSWCEVAVRIGGNVNPLSFGDLVEVQVYEDDSPLFDDLLWETQLSVSAAEATGGSLDRVLNCAAAFGDDLGTFFEVYARARIDKSSGGVREEAETPTIDVQIVDDDAAEDDDSAVRASPLDVSGVDSRIARDQDWYSVVLADDVALDVSAAHLTAAGRVSLLLRDSAQATVAVGGDGPNAVGLDDLVLSPGTYYVEVSPRQAGDYAFYDLSFSTELLSCVPDVSESRECGNCGTETRLCGADGSWGAWSACAGEGSCPVGSVEVIPCPGGTARRVCDARCSWGDYQPCVPDPLGAPCVDDAECGSMRCLGEDGLFEQGYCGVVACPSDAVCGASGACLPAFGTFFCLLRCDSADDCRTGYLCLDIEGVAACVPRCRSSADCADPQLPVCEQASGRCVDPGSAGDAGLDDAGLDDAGLDDAGLDGGAAFDAPGSDGAAADSGRVDSAGSGDAATDGDGPQGIIGEQGNACGCHVGSGADARGALVTILGVLLLRLRRRIRASIVPRKKTASRLG